jgi:hypothetical protein
MALHTKSTIAALVVLSITGTSLQGCSGATAAGCGVGVLATLALVGLAAASSGDDLDGDVGTVVLGSTIIGSAVGCPAAAVAEAIARSDEQERAEANDRARAEVLREVDRRLRHHEQTRALAPSAQAPPAPAPPAPAPSPNPPTDAQPGASEQAPPASSQTL